MHQPLILLEKLVLLFCKLIALQCHIEAVFRPGWGFDILVLGLMYGSLKIEFVLLLLFLSSSTWR